MYFRYFFYIYYLFIRLLSPTCIRVTLQRLQHCNLCKIVDFKFRSDHDHHEHLHFVTQFPPPQPHSTPTKTNFVPLYQLFSKGAHNQHTLGVVHWRKRRECVMSVTKQMASVAQRYTLQRIIFCLNRKKLFFSAG